MGNENYILQPHQTTNLQYQNHKTWPLNTETLINTNCGKIMANQIENKGLSLLKYLNEIFGNNKVTRSEKI